MIKVIFVYALMALSISYVAIQEDRVLKGFKRNPKDGDGDGFIQDGTRWQRKAKK